MLRSRERLRTLTLWGSHKLAYRASIGEGICSLVQRVTRMGVRVFPFDLVALLAQSFPVGSCHRCQPKVGSSFPVTLRDRVAVLGVVMDHDAGRGPRLEDPFHNSVGCNQFSNVVGQPICLESVTNRTGPAEVQQMLLVGF